MEIAIYCTPLSRRLLISRHGEEPIKVERSDVLYSQLQASPARGGAARLPQAQKVLTRTIRLEVSNELGRFLTSASREHLVGLLLYKFHINDLLSFAEAQHMAGVSVQASLRNFLNMHDIEEDEYGLDTAYKAWQRLKQRQTRAILTRSAAKIVRHPKGKFRDRREDPRWILRAVAQVYQAPITYLLGCPVSIKTPHGRFYYHYDAQAAATRYYVQARAVYAYLCWLDGSISTPTIAKSHIHLDESHLRRLIRGIRHESKHNDLLAGRIAQVRALLTAWRGANTSLCSAVYSPYVHAV